MGASAKRKKEKKKDFQVSGLFSPFGLFEVLIREDEQKPKLKVGKTRPKASNFTDTSFQSKGELSRSLRREGERHWSDREEIARLVCKSQLDFALGPSFRAQQPTDYF